jgi:uncharacterized protein YgiM (DUF1202 family)
MKRLINLVLVVILFASLASAQTGVVTRNVNLRPDASTNNNPVEKLKPGAQVHLLESSPTGGFFHVQTASGNSGFVWAKNVQIKGDTGGGQPTAVSSIPSTSGGDLLTQLMAARKGAVGQPLIENGTQVCGPTGDAPDQKTKDLNDNKNRTDQPGDPDYVEINWDDLKTLPTDRVNDLQGAPVAVVGFLSHKINVENSGKGESTNCHLTGNNEVDWHIYLTKTSAQPISQAIIVETTPRTRPSHKWTTGILQPVVDSQTQVRISGWLIYDWEHVGVIGTQRATVWEVHPITRIQIQQNGQWVDLDSQQ